MDMPSFLSAVVGGIVVWLISFVVGEMITRPKLIFYDLWNKSKWVGRFETRKKTISVPKTPFISSLSSISDSMEVETNIDERVKTDEAYFDFYGITIKNEDDPNIFIHRRVAEITRTTLLLDDGQEIECRWWTRDYSEIDKLFVGIGFDIDDRRKINIASGTSEHIVIAYRDSEGSDYYLFDIVSDVQENFWNNDRMISKFPRYAILKIFTSANMTTIKLEISLSNDTKNELIIKKIPKFPESVLIKDFNL